MPQSVSLENVETIAGELQSSQELTSDLHSNLNIEESLYIPRIIDSTCVFYGTTEHWNSKDIVPQAGTIYIYSDYDKEGNTFIPAFKIGDGNSHLIDLPFATSKKSIYYFSTEEWKTRETTVSAKGCLYIYSDYFHKDSGDIMPGIKVGDGSTYIVDLPFLFEDTLNEIKSHIANKEIHITSEERQDWNSKVTASVNNNTLRFSI